MKQFILYFLIAFAPLAAHTPPILTTTAIIEVYEAGQFKGIVLIESGEGPLWEGYSRWQGGIWRDRRSSCQARNAGRGPSPTCKMSGSFMSTPTLLATFATTL